MAQSYDHISGLYGELDETIVHDAVIDMATIDHDAVTDMVQLHEEIDSLKWSLLYIV